MADRYFGPRDVEALIPELSEIMAAVMAAYAEVVDARARLRAEEQRIAISGGGVIDRERWQQDREVVERRKRDVDDGLARIGELGGTVKDLSLGLVDFPHLRDGREVNLCWKVGERDIRYWHGLDEGYAARKRLDGEAE